MQTLPAGRHLQFLHSSLAEQKSSALGRESSQSHPEEGFENTNPKQYEPTFLQTLAVFALFICATEAVCIGKAFIAITS